MQKNLTAKEELPGLLTIKQVCYLLNVHPNTLRNWDRKGIIRVVRFGVRRDRRFRKKDILKIVERK